MRKIVLFSFITILIFSSCDNTSDEYEMSIGYVTVELPDSITLTMKAEWQTYYNNEEQRINDEVQTQFDVLYDQWNRNLITTEEFQESVDELNEYSASQKAALEYLLNTEPWWEPPEITVSFT